MRIAFFARVPSPEILETVNFYSQDIRALRELGHEVILATRFGEIPSGCDVYYAWWWTWAFQPYLRAFPARKPLIVTGVFDYDTPPKLGGSYLGRPWHQRLLLRTMLARANANIFISRYELDLMRSRFAPPNSFHVPCSVDTDLYRPGAAPRTRFLLNIAWSGAANGQRKCLMEIVEALPIVLRSHPDVRLVMAGRPGELHGRLVAAAQQLGVRDKVDFVGLISESEKVRLMQTCAVYLQPTLGEGFGLAMAEAMACGAPLVTNPAGAVPEVVGDGAVLVASPLPHLVADAAATLLAAPERAAELGRRARDHVARNFTYPVRREGLAKVIASVT